MQSGFSSRVSAAIPVPLHLACCELFYSSAPTQNLIKSAILVASIKLYVAPVL